MTKMKKVAALVISTALILGLYCPIAVNAEVESESTKIIKQGVLYEDDFLTDSDYIAALGNTGWQTYKRPIWEDGKLISGDYTAAADAKFALLNGLGADSWTNYTVEADITAGTANDRVCYVAAYGRTTGDKQAGDAYRFSYSGNSKKFLLTRNATGASGNKADLVTNIAITGYFSDYNKGDTIRMSITAVTYKDYVNLICKATYGGETKEIINYKDTSAGRYTCGMPGFGLQQQNSSLDNVEVAKIKIANGSVLYEDDFTTNDNYLTAVGNTDWQTGDNVPPLWDEENGRLVSDSDGNHNFTLLNGLGADNWTNYTVEADINTGSISARTCYVAAYGRTVGSNNQGQSYQFICTGAGGKFMLRKYPVSAVLETNISNYFDTYDYNNSIHMSITAVTCADYVNLICEATYAGVTKVVFNYKDADEARYTCGLPGFGLQKQNSSLDNVIVVKIDESELGTGAVLYEDDFSASENYSAACGSGWQRNPYVSPIWDEENYRLKSDAEGSKHFALLNGIGADDWTNYTVEADINTGSTSSKICYVAAYGTTSGNTDQGNSYQFICTGADGKFQLRRYPDTTVLEKTNINAFFNTYDYNNSIHMAITAITYDNYVNLICEATYDGVTKVIFNCRDTSVARYTCGLPGFGLQKQNSWLDNLRIVKTEPILYEDDFTTAEKYTSVLGAKWQRESFVPLLWDASGKLISNSTGNQNFTLLNGLGADSWTNYTVEADITASYADKNTGRSCYVAAYGTTSGDNRQGNSYQFICTGVEGKFKLRKFPDSAVLETDIRDYFDTYDYNNSIHMAITAVTYEDYVNIICAATYNGVTKEIFNYEDNSAERYTCGMPGFGLQKENCSLDNVKVTSVAIRHLTIPVFKTVEFSNHSLVIDYAIGVNFFMNLDGLTESQKAASYMTFGVDGSAEQKIAFFNGDFTDQGGHGYYGFVCKLSSVQMADEITPTFHYIVGGEEQTTVGNTYSAKNYIDYVLSHTQLYEDNVVNLVHAIGNYGYYAQQNFTTKTVTALSTDYRTVGDYSSSYETKKELLASYAHTKSDTYVYNLNFDSQTILLIRYNGTLNVTFDSVVSGEDAYTNKYTRYNGAVNPNFVELQLPLPVLWLEGKFTVTGVKDGTPFTITDISAFSYIYGILDKSSNTNLKNMICALHDYYLAAYQFGYDIDPQLDAEWF